MVDGKLLYHFYADNSSVRVELERKVYELNEIVKLVPGFVFWKDKESVLQGCNNNFARQVGLDDASKIVGLTDHDMPWDESETARFLEDDRQVMRTGRPLLDIEEPQKQLDGTEKTLLTSKVPLRDKANKVCGVLGSYVDITSLKESQHKLERALVEVEAANQSKQEFLKNVRHDIRTPFTGIYSLVTMMLEHEDDPQKKEYLNIVAQSANRLLDFLNEILDYVQVTDGNMPILQRPFSPVDVVETVIEKLRPVAVNKNIELSYTVVGEIPINIISDRRRLVRIILNLTSNALKFIEKGAVEIKLRCLHGKKGDNLKIEVIDTGIGIADEFLPYIFEPFYRVKGSYEGTYTGSGLGLQIVKQFSDDLGGQVTVKSKKGEGSRFTVVIPIEEPLDQEAT